MRKLRFRNVKSYTQGYSANIAPRWNLSPGWLTTVLQMLILEVSRVRLWKCTC